MSKYDLYSLPNIVRVVKSRRTRLAGHVAPLVEDRVEHKGLVGKPERKRSLGRQNVELRIVLRWIFRK